MSGHFFDSEFALGRPTGQPYGLYSVKRLVGVNVTGQIHEFENVAANSVHTEKSRACARAFDRYETLTETSGARIPH
jgi:hypothetical protein